MCVCSHVLESVKESDSTEKEWRRGEICVSSVVTPCYLPNYFVKYVNRYFVPWMTIHMGCSHMHVCESIPSCARIKGKKVGATEKRNRWIKKINSKTESMLSPVLKFRDVCLPGRRFVFDLQTRIRRCFFFGTVSANISPVCYEWNPQEKKKTRTQIVHHEMSCFFISIGMSCQEKCMSGRYCVGHLPMLEVLLWAAVKAQRKGRSPKLIVPHLLKHYFKLQIKHRPITSVT